MQRYIYIMHKCIKYLFLADLKASRQAGGREAVGIDGGAHELAMIRAQVCLCVCGVCVGGWVGGRAGGVCVLCACV